MANIEARPLFNRTEAAIQMKWLDQISGMAREKLPYRRDTETHSSREGDTVRTGAS
jgi:hypothetical protein